MKIIDSLKKLHYTHKVSIALTIIAMLSILYFIIVDGREKVRFFTYYLPPKYRMVNEAPDFSCVKTAFIAKQYFFEHFDGEITVFPHKNKVFYFARDASSTSSTVYYTTCGYVGRDYHGGNTVYISRMSDGEVVRVFERSILDLIIVLISSFALVYLSSHALMCIIHKCLSIFVCEDDVEEVKT